MAAEWRDFLEPLGPGRMRISKHGSMLTDAILIADEQHMAEHSDDRSPNQLVNTACLPGIVGEAWAMADWHFGYGFPIGGVVAGRGDIARRSRFRHQLRSQAVRY